MVKQIFSVKIALGHDIFDFDAMNRGGLDKFYDYFSGHEDTKKHSQFPYDLKPDIRIARSDFRF